jgi:23S rRNA pseudouridine1911/1915/1917 synthase
VSRDGDPESLPESEVIRIDEAITLAVPREAAGARVDRFLAAALVGTARAPSRSELQRWIENGRVTIDGVPCGVADKLREGSRIRVVPEPPPRTRAIPESGVLFDVLYVDSDVVVVNKPPGLVVHPARGHESGTLVNGLLALGVFDAFGEGGAVDGHERPGIVHRLDKGTSGVMVVARNAHARERLKQQFAEHSIERAYEAIAVGDVADRTFSTLHGRHPVDRLRFTTNVRDGKRAVTHVRVLARLADGRATRIECRLETGRTHQIRVHLAESGTPILADPLYGRPPRDRELRAIADELGHQALHARVLGFTHPTSGERVRFESPVPDDFARALRELIALS